MNAAFDLVLYPFSGIAPMWGLVFLSGITGIGLLFLFKWTSNQDAIAASKSKIGGYLMEIRLFSDDVRQVLKAQNAIVLTNFVYLGHMVKPLCVALVPFFFIAAQMNFRYGMAPLEVGQPTMLTVELSSGVDAVDAGIELIAPEGVVVETPGVRAREAGLVAWRIRPDSAGRHELRLRDANGVETLKVLDVGGTHRMVSPRRPSTGWVDRLMYPTEPPIPDGGQVASVEVVHPALALPFLGLDWNWIVAFLVFSMVFAYALKGVFGVKI